jgi:hypothetical protein
MQTCRVETTVQNDGTIIIEGLPLGDKVEIIARRCEDESHPSKR